MQKRRLDTLLAERGLFPSRSRAAASVMAGEVRVGSGGRRAQKPGEMVAVEELLKIDERPRFVSRGGIKLSNALDASGLDVAGRRALDVGASTGGFSDCLLQRGAVAVTAVDVAYGELAWGVRSDERVTVLERTNARALEPAMLPYAPDLAVLDLSFISLAKVLGAVLACLAPGYDALALVKPQFEVGRGRVGSGGVVRDPDERRGALVDVGTAAVSLGAAVLGYHSSGLPGPKGNRETFVWLADPLGQRASTRAGAILPEVGVGTGAGVRAGSGASAGAAESAVAGESATRERLRERLDALAREVEP
jgi:23S rRNA (cytidine1920-2'-O)/16S rRNA (cytidine1409-2'-O)-methyltransferase